MGTKPTSLWCFRCMYSTTQQIVHYQQTTALNHTMCGYLIQPSFHTYHQMAIRSRYFFLAVNWLQYNYSETNRIDINSSITRWQSFYTFFLEDKFQFAVACNNQLAKGNKSVEMDDMILLATQLKSLFLFTILGCVNKFAHFVPNCKVFESFLNLKKLSE